MTADPRQTADPQQTADPRHIEDPRYLELWRLTKSYPTPRGESVIVRDFSLLIPRGEFVAIIGHSGCGKSTVLSMVAGLTPITSGAVVVDNREIDGPGLDRGVVFQSPCLLPWMTALENVALAAGQANPGLTRAGREAIALRRLAEVGMEDAAQKRPGELSQGMRQRVGIARAFALSPKVLLLDEPFGMLDCVTRMELQETLIGIWGSERQTALMVTHDVDEAILLSDRIVMMTRGPEAGIGEIITVPFPRPRVREEVIALPEFYRLRERILAFLNSQEPGGSAGADSPSASEADTAHDAAMESTDRLNVEDIGGSPAKTTAPAGSAAEELEEAVNE